MVNGGQRLDRLTYNADVESWNLSRGVVVRPTHPPFSPLLSKSICQSTRVEYGGIIINT